MSALTLGKWVGLGEHIESRFVEQTLLNHGLGVFYVQPEGEVADSGGDGVLEEPRFTFRQASAGGELSDQWVSTRYRTTGPGGTQRTLYTKGPLADWDCVPVYANIAAQMGYMRYAKETISFYADRLAEAAMTVDINLSNTRTQRVAITSKKQAKTSEMLSDAIDNGNQSLVLLDSEPGHSLDEMVSVLDFSVHPQQVETAHGVFVRVLGEAYNALGIQAEQNEKQAQQSVVEVESDDSMVRALRLAMLESRWWAADKLNKRYDLEVDFIDSGTGRGSNG